VIELEDIAYVRSGAADLPAAVRFATDVVGLELVASDEQGVAHLRADARHHCLALVAGRSGVLASGLVTQQKCLARPVAFGRAAGITEFGHLCLDAPDVHEAYRFWSGTFNAKVSDWIGDAACLMRIDPVHHKLAVFKGDGPGLCHMNFQVASIDDVFRNWHFLVDHGVEIEMGPGRHPQSTAVFIYFLGPESFTYEYSFGVRRIEDDAAWRPRTFDPAEPGSIDMWLGPTSRPITQPQARDTQDPARVADALSASLSG
jgi:2,3-dihydroxy-p-cumate/2,3-dihydroxybenzoate 3,4-dioxygenase